MIGWEQLTKLKHNHGDIRISADIIMFRIEVFQRHFHTSLRSESALEMAKVSCDMKVTSQ